MAATGQECYEERYSKIAKPLALKGISTIIPCQPLYGKRRISQKRAGHIMPTFNHLMMMGTFAISEAEAISNLILEKNAKVCLSGVSMGALLSTLVSGMVRS